jgi:hypothetical protein
MFGMTLGSLMAISIRYPVKIDAITQAQTMCKENLGLFKMKVGISGKVYRVECTNKKVFDLK